MSDGRPGWDRYFLGIADAVAVRGDCTRRQVGCVILDASRRVIGTGYNGVRSGELGCLSGGCDRGKIGYDQLTPGTAYDSCPAIHAELNALLFSDTMRMSGGTMYVTCEPCAWCWKIIRGTTLDRVVWPDGAQCL